MLSAAYSSENRNAATCREMKIRLQKLPNTLSTLCMPLLQGFYITQKLGYMCSICASKKSRLAPQESFWTRTCYVGSMLNGVPKIFSCMHACSQQHGLYLLYTIRHSCRALRIVTMIRCKRRSFDFSVATRGQNYCCQNHFAKRAVDRSV